ncbi:MAG: hypothetical protein QM779_09165 [Propionicimonas sp.]|uniref:hypothetical protein n=1 Tax=Propionicimonas sp. TaxID=1955623 RepID=UPI003D0C77C0
MKLKLAALATTGVLALTGCATGNPQIAAYVNGTPISQAQVDGPAQALANASSDTADTGSAFSATVLSIMIQSKVAAAAAAADPSLAVTQEKRDSEIAGNETLAALVKDPAATDFINDYVEASLIVSTDAGKAAFTKQFAATSVDLNPRFGTWDPTQFSIVDGSNGSLSSEAPIKQE